MRFPRAGMVEHAVSLRRRWKTAVQRGAHSDSVDLIEDTFRIVLST